MRNAAASRLSPKTAPPLSPGDFIGNWMALMAPAAEKSPRGDLSPADYLTRLEQANIVNSLDNLMTFPCLATLIETRQVETARRLFRRRHRGIVGAGPGERRIPARGGERTPGRFRRRGSRRGLHLSPRAGRGNYAAFLFASISLRLISTSAICTALSAAPLRRLSDTTHISRPFSTVRSLRMRLI